MIGTRQDEHVHYSASVFRHILDSLARPGKLTQLPYPHHLGEPPRTPSSTIANFYALGALLTLLDREVSFAVAEHGVWQSRDTEIVQWLALRSGASLAEPSDAHFVLFCDGSSDSQLLQLNEGTLLEPEESATAIYCVTALDTEIPGPIMLELSGPGIETTHTVSITGLDRLEIAHIVATRQRYPLGVDIYLIDENGRCLGLPRTTRLRLLESARQKEHTR
ncbi:alpha-D-ribose 1-methylphosphonate 5-triphosphate synthase subunit PhnH [Thermosporothrix hazakensis]|jgi:alpha-D-ribose 1-methylphosphonate 5-triphosphate synthase subunit PhnH|uniref:Alpha-D-ribose 1-methylphosphonate 5-triphosphate synthase subunit PhnH n=2 Tax=Thermosporothrix TaxID=768650 RepID=A0A326UC39_THEHA|nr:phosphonate C-P lyase system protein PhnH [Thermosporothrix hazakensis]PZW32935.1 alpha-D-ribose 1-methylphosphonate 5-triphosphate synthase subunit PhnH [Thermosporothrix hazakensis]BBH90917.1 phosphonate C-P lyase system protein PhnH [Thermosporothrix sp. COM3]GCE48967.1 phosphonate C-P lyase system protein PhnH [Thermosporothrix hazakensis]